jgi:hypothetical protein
MFRHSSKLILVGLAAVAVQASPGCSNNKKMEDQGSANVSVSQSLSLAGDVKAVDVTVSGTNIPTPMTMPLFLQADGSWKALVSHIPTGTDRVFAAKAYDSVAKSNEIYSGSVSMVTINKDTTANVTIVLQENVANPGFANHSPVVDGVTVSSSKAVYGQKVAYTLTAHDQDAGETATLVFTPAVSCGSFGSPTLTTDGNGRRVWAALWTAPASGTSCQLNMEVKDARGAKTMSATTIALWAGQETGSAAVATEFQSYPMIQNIEATPVAPATVFSVGGAVQLDVLATQPDGKAMTFAWTSDCTGSFDNAAAKSPVFTLTTAAPTCMFNVVVSNPVSQSNNGSGTTTDIALSTVGHLEVAVGAAGATPALGAVEIDLSSQSRESINGGESVTLYVRARETNSGATLSSYAWTTVGSGLGTQTDAPDMSFSQIVWTAPAGFSAAQSVTVTVTDSQGSSANFVFVIRSASNPCVGASDGTACEDGNPCTLNDTCQAGACTSGAAKSCVAADACHTDGACDTATGACSTPAAADGTTCVDSDACSTASACSAGVCVATSMMNCTAMDQCHLAGTCSAGVCSNPAKVDGATCSDGDSCTTGESCQAGVCGSGAPVICAAPGVCNTAACVPGTGCVVTPASDGTACSDGNGCTTGDVCLAGACVSGAPLVCTASDLCHTAGTCDAVAGLCSAETVKTCDYGSACTPTTGTCDLTCPSPSYAKNYGVASVGGLTVDAAGNQYIVAKLFGTQNFGSGNVTSAGSSDIVLAKMDPTAANPADAVWTKVFGGSGEGANPSDQIPTGVAVNATGKLAILGNYTGNLVVNSSLNIAGVGAPLDFVMGTDATGAGQWGVKVDTQAGALMSVAGNPARNEFVLCGYAVGGVTDLGLSGSYGDAANPENPLEDIIIAKLSDTGSVVWARQIGGVGSQLCRTVALGADGTVYAAGAHNGTLDFGDGALPVLGSSVQAVWVAKFDGADGHTLVSKSFGTIGKQAATSIAVDSQGNVAISGNLRNSVAFGSYTVTSAGALDAYVVKLNASLIPQWATRWGDAGNDQITNSVAFTSIDDIVTVGTIKGSATLGSTTLTSAGLKDAYWAKLNGVNGSVVCGAIYGNAAYDQSLDVVAISRVATGSQKDKISVAGFGNGGFSIGSTNLTSTTANGFIAQLNP